MTSEDSGSYGPDPLRGIDGLERAWNRFYDWLTWDLPRQWDELAGLIAQIGGVQPPSGGGVVPVPVPTGPANGLYEIPLQFSLGALATDAERAQALDYVRTWPSAVAAGSLPQYRYDTFKTATPEIVAMCLLGWVGFLGVSHIQIGPIDVIRELHPERTPWIPGSGF